jgi:hypothetical protein
MRWLAAREAIVQGHGTALIVQDGVGDLQVAQGFRAAKERINLQAQSL